MSHQEPTPSKRSGETVILSFSFPSATATPTGLTCTVTQVSSRVQDDPNPALTKSGTPYPGADPTLVLQKFTGGIHGCTYEVVVTGTTLEGEVLSAAIVIPVDDHPR